MWARIVEEEGIQQDVEIAVASDHAVEYHLQEVLPTCSKTGSALLSLTPECLHEPAGSSLGLGDRESMSGLPQSLAMSGLELQVAMAHVAVPSSHGERYRVHGDHDIIPRGGSVKRLDVLP